MSSARQVALILHGLADADRAWLLGRLPPAQVGMLEPLLAELRELGIPADPELAAQVHDAEMRRVTQTIRECSLPQLQSALADEPHAVAPVSRWARFVRWLESAATRLRQRGRA